MQSGLRRIVSVIIILNIFIFQAVYAKTDSSKVSAVKKYKIGLPQVPGVMWRNANGDVKGFPVELFEAIAEDEQIKYEWVEAPWPKLYDLILKGEIDALPGTQETQERLKRLDFIENSLQTMWSELIVNKETKFENLSSVSGKRIGIVIGDNNGIGFEKYIKEFNMPYTKVDLVSHEMGVKLLKNGEIFALVAPSFYLKSDKFKSLKHAGLYFNPSNLKIAFPKGKNKELKLLIDKRLEIYKQDPNSIYNKLFVEYHLSKYANPEYFIPKWLSILLLIIFMFLITGIVFILLLRKQVQIKTQSINQREIYLRRTMELGNMGTWFIDLNKWEIEWSRELYDLLGYNHDTTMSFEFLREIVHKDDVLRLTRLFFDSIRLHKNFEIEFKVRKSDGTILYTKQIGVVFCDDDGKTTKVFGIAQNITQQKKYDEQLIKAKDKAEESERLKSVFLANMSHEIRTPLNAIVGFSALIAKGNTDEKKRISFLSIIEKQNNLLLNLINDIIDFAKIESKSLTINITDNVNLDLVIKEVYDTLSPHCPENVEFKLVENKFGTQYLLRTDLVRLKQIINNLIINAFKNTAEGFVELGYRKNSIDSKLDIYVLDTGDGVPEEHRIKIFERFHQVDELSQGTGLGLAICQSLAEMLGGQIKIKSTSIEGSEFVLELPNSVIQSAGEELYASSLIEDEIDVDSISLKGFKFLAAEDIDSNYLFLTTILEEKGAVLERAKNGIEAIQMATVGKYDMVLMDIKMPELDGLSATKDIKDVKPDLPIVAVTAHAFDADRTKALEAGCDDYISKPVDRGEMLEIIGRILEIT